MSRWLLVIVLAGAAAGCGERAVAPTAAGNAAGRPAVASGEQLFIACQGCHGVAAGAPHGVGPNLHNFWDAAAASRPGFDYSPALREAGLTWNRGTLPGWILGTETLVPGTWMLYHNILEPGEVARLVDYLEQVTQADAGMP